ncbi:MAG: glycoside hydrolase family protein [Bdellovibrionales bacterium]|nr:glycoside hydrolase family protein [Bdellovibrionales bacterium]
MKKQTTFLLISLLMITTLTVVAGGNNLLPVGDNIYVQEKGLTMLAGGSRSEVYQRINKRQKSYYKITGHHKGWAYTIKKVNIKGDEIDGKEYQISTKMFGKGMHLLVLDELINTINTTVEKSTLAPALDHCPSCEHPTKVKAKVSSGKKIKPENFRISDRAIRMIQVFEGCIRCGYSDVKQFSIGYGTRLSGNYNMARDQELVANTRCLELRKGRACTAKKKSSKYDVLTYHCQCASGGKAAKKADALMRAHFKNTGILKFIKQEIKIPLEQHQVDVLASWYYNFGKRKYKPNDSKSPSFSHYLNQGNLVEGAKRMSWWRKSGGKAVDGLIVRRAKEHYIFMNGGEIGDVPFQTKSRAIDYYYRHSKLKR